MICRCRCFSVVWRGFSVGWWCFSIGWWGFCGWWWRFSVSCCCCRSRWNVERSSLNRTQFRSFWCNKSNTYIISNTDYFNTFDAIADSLIKVFPALYWKGEAGTAPPPDHMSSPLIFSTVSYCTIFSSV